MKRLIFIATISLFAAVACQKTVVPQLSVSPGTVSFDANGGASIISVSSNTEWTVSTSDSWISTETKKGSGSDVFTIEVPAFTEASARSGQVVLTAGELRQTIAVVQGAPLAPEETQESSFKVLALGQTLEVEVPEGYSFTVVNEASWISVETSGNVLTLTIAPNAQALENRSATVCALFGEDVLAQVNVEQSFRNVEPGELIIEEVYFTGSPIEGSSSPSDDQYIKLTNNSDRLIYADRVMFVTSFISGTITSVGAYYEYPALEDALAVENMYVIPGNGDDYPLEPGESLILALAAKDYKGEGNPNAIDLSTADFEFYDENEYWPDTDNPDVPNLEIWFKASATITTLHQRGFESYAICVPPYNETAESILANRHWTGTYTFYFNEYVIPRNLDSQDVWVIPGDWVLDAVNCALEDVWYQNPWPVAFDAGWTFCGGYDGDPARFGKSVRRRSAEGKFADTNNSTNDFEPNSTPSLK